MVAEQVALYSIVTSAYNGLRLVCGDRGGGRSKQSNVILEHSVILEYFEG